MIGRINLVGAYGSMAPALLTISDDVSANYGALVAKVDKLKTTDESLQAFVSGLKQQIIDLTTQLADAGVDATKLAAVRDGLVTLGQSIDAVEAADAIIATP